MAKITAFLRRRGNDLPYIHILHQGKIIFALNCGTLHSLTWNLGLIITASCLVFFTKHLEMVSVLRVIIL